MAEFEGRGPNLVIRPVELGDSAGILEGILQGELEDSVPGSERVRDVDDANGMVGGLIQKWAAGLEMHFSICLKTGKVVGMCAIYDFEPERQSARIGYWISRPYRRQGYGKEAVGLLTKIAFHDFGITKIYAVANPKNIASVRLMRSLNFVADDSPWVQIRQGEQLFSLRKPS